MNRKEAFKIKLIKNRWLILTIVGLITFMDDLDASIVNVALPVINRSLSISMSVAELIVSIYLIVICIFLLPFGKLGDLIGKGKVFKIGMIIFTVGSLLSGISFNITFLLISRVIQALGAAMTMSTNNGIITETFPQQNRGQALGWIGTFVALGMIAGPGIGGILLEFLPWQSIFWINVPIGVILIVLGFVIIPEDNIKLGSHTFWPLIDFKIFKNWDFMVGLITAILVFMTNNFYMVLTPFYLENTKSLSASLSGMIMMILPLVQSIIAPLSGRLTDNNGAWKIAITGLWMIFIVQLGLVLLNSKSSIYYVGLMIGFLGLGNAIFQSPNNTMIMSSVDETQLGAAGSINALARNLGMVLGNVTSTWLLFLIMSHLAKKSITDYTGKYTNYFISGQHLIYILGGILLFIALLLSKFRTNKK